MARKPGIRILSFIAVAVTVTLYLELAPVPAASSNVAFSNQALAASLNGAEQSSADRFAFSSDGNLLASATDDGHIALLSLLSGRQRLIGPAPFSASVADLSFSPDGKTLASASEDAITLWDVRTGQADGSWQHRKCQCYGYCLQSGWQITRRCSGRRSNPGLGYRYRVSALDLAR